MTEIKQNTQAWLEAKQSKIGASEIFSRCFLKLRRVDMFLDKKGKELKIGDILFYSENTYGCDEYHYADSIMEVVMYNNQLATITRICNVSTTEIGGCYGVISDTPLTLQKNIHDPRDCEIIGTIKNDKNMLTVKYAKKHFSLKNKYLGKNPNLKIENILKSIREIAENCVELNMNNYDESQVEEINNAMIEIHKIIKND